MSNARILPTFDAAKTYVLLFAIAAGAYLVYKAYSKSSSALDDVIDKASHPFDTAQNWWNKVFNSTGPTPSDIITTNPDGSVTHQAYTPSDAAPPDWLGGGPPLPPSGSTTTSYPDTGGNIPFPGTLPNGETPADNATNVAAGNPIP